jgi:hypothetical protein
MKQDRLPSNSFHDLVAKIPAETLVSDNIPLVFGPLEHPEEDVRVSEIHMTGP